MSKLLNKIELKKLKKERNNEACLKSEFKFKNFEKKW